MQETDDDHIRIRLTGKERIKLDVDLLVEEIGNVLSIEAKRTKRTLFNKMAVRDLTLTIDVPKKVFESIRMEIYNGKLKASQLYATHVNAEADNAEIRLEAVEAEHVMVATNNGTIVLASCNRGCHRRNQKRFHSHVDPKPGLQSRLENDQWQY